MKTLLYRGKQNHQNTSTDRETIKRLEWKMSHVLNRIELLLSKLEDSH